MPYFPMLDFRRYNNQDHRRRGLEKGNETKCKGDGSNAKIKAKKNEYLKRVVKKKTKNVKTKL